MYRRNLGAKVKMKHLRAWAKRIQYSGSSARYAYNKDYLLIKIKKRTQSICNCEKAGMGMQEGVLETSTRWAEGKEKKRIKDIRKREENKHQWRIWKNIPTVKWKNKVHEVLEGHKTYAPLPAMEDFALYHPKNIEKQEKQNSYYNTL